MIIHSLGVDTHMHTYQFSRQRQVQEITRMPGLKMDYMVRIYVYKAENHLSVCLSALSGRSDSQLWLHGLTSDLLDVIAMFSGITKVIF